jgi:hypothetical protein
MAGPYTHLTIAHGAMLDGRLSPDLIDRLQTWASFTYLGALSPDMPYATLDSEITDTYHQRHTGRFLAACIRELRRLRAEEDSNAEALDAIEAWVYGYASHLVVDTFLHPLNEITVGAGSGELDPLRHRECEMTQDTLLVAEMHEEGTEISSGAYSYTLRMALDAEFFDDVAEFWERIHDDVYGEIAPDTGPRLWAPSFVELMELLEEGQAVQHFTRHIHSDAGGHVRFSDSDTLRNERPDLVTDYFEHVTLPDGSIAHFAYSIFPKAVDAVLGLWDILEAVIEDENEAMDVEFASWNLDSGTDIPGGQLVFW